jgi:hypothetical protein
VLVDLPVVTRSSSSKGCSPRSQIIEARCYGIVDERRTWMPVIVLVPHPRLGHRDTAIVPGAWAV